MFVISVIARSDTCYNWLKSPKRIRLRYDLDGWDAFANVEGTTVGLG